MPMMSSKIKNFAVCTNYIIETLQECWDKKFSQKMWRIYVKSDIYNHVSVLFSSIYQVIKNLLIQYDNNESHTGSKQ